MADTSTGWVKLFRSFTKWEWYTEPNVMRVFLHLLLTASATDNVWRGTLIKRGQVSTSYRHIAESLGMDIHTAHRAVNKLKISGEITVESNAKFSIITLNNYDCFQGNATKTQRVRNAGATQTQPTKEYKNIRIKEEDAPAALSADAENFTGWKAREGHDF